MRIVLNYNSCPPSDYSLRSKDIRFPTIWVHYIKVLVGCQGLFYPFLPFLKRFYCVWTVFDCFSALFYGVNTLKKCLKCWFYSLFWTFREYFTMFYRRFPRGWTEKRVILPLKALKNCVILVVASFLYVFDGFILCGMVKQGWIIIDGSILSRSASTVSYCMFIIARILSVVNR